MADSSLVYPKTESRNSGFRSPEETQRTINFLLAELAKVQERVDRLNESNANLAKRATDLEESLDGLRGCYRDIEDRFFLLVQVVECLQAGRLH